MNRSHTTGAPRAGWSHQLRLGLSVLALTLAAACNTDTLVNLQNPDIITGGVARDTANLEQLRNGTLYEFARAYTGPAVTNGTPGIIGVAGVMSDELWYASTFPTMKEIDSRTITLTNTDLLTAYQYIHRARNLAERAAEQYATTSEANSPDHALVTSLAGYTYLWFAENFCSGVPVSSTDFNGEVVFGAPLTTGNLLDSAIVRFDAAIARAGTDADMLSLARLGKARALLDKDTPAAAATLAATVPSNFEYDVNFSDNSSGQTNGINQNINIEKRTSAASGEGTNGIVFFTRKTGANVGIDPRVRVDSSGGNTTPTPLYLQQKYPQRGSPIPLASGIEARLIEAEAALNKGTSGTYVALLNTLRTTNGVPGVLVDPVTPTARVRQFMTERAFWLWLTGHRLGDLRRMVRYYGLAANTVFPIGQTIQGDPYGPDLNLPIPFQEENNPQFPTGQCIDRNP
jgi:hypothetical protein